MDDQDSSISEQSPEFRIDMSTTEMVTEQASQDMGSKDMEADQASQDCSNTTKEVHKVRSSEGMATDRALQAGCRTSKVVHEKGSSEGMATNKAFQDGPNTARAFQDGPDTAGEHKEGSPEDLPALTQDLVGWCLEQENMMPKFKEHKEGCSGEKPAIFEDAKGWWMEQRDVMSAKGAMVALDLESKKCKALMCNSFAVKPEVVVNADSRSWFDTVLKGDWEEIEKILNVNPTAMMTKVMIIEDKPESDHLTLLDVAIMTGQDQLVEKLVSHLPPEFEELNLSRALRHAARRGRVRMVKALVDKIRPEPTIIQDALEFAAESAPDQKELLWYLVRSLECPPKADILFGLFLLGHADISLYLAHKYPDSWTFKDLEAVKRLKFLGLMTSYFRSGDRLKFWEKCVYKFIPLCLVDTLPDDSKNTKMALGQVALNRIKILLWNLVTTPAPFIKRIGELKLRHDCSLNLAKLALTTMKDYIDASDLLKILLTSGLVLDAASRGASEIVILCLRYFPQLLWNIDFTVELRKEIVKGRHVELFRLAAVESLIQCLDDVNPPRRIILYDAVTKWSSRCVPRDVSGAAFLLQRELQWFQGVAGPIHDNCKMKFQQNRKSYWEDFAEQRKELLKEAGKWMKDTSSSCSLVATLIITVAFAAAFTVPGGNDNNTGIPIFLKNGSFMVFAVADALALFCAITATLMFLTILTSRYAIDDFLHSLPSKMVLGLTFLFLSLAFMLVAFGSTLAIFLSERWKWSYIPIALLAAFPVVLFIILQLPLYIEMFESTYWPRLYRPLTLWK